MTPKQPNTGDTATRPQQHSPLLRSTPRKAHITTLMSPNHHPLHQNIPSPHLQTAHQQPKLPIPTFLSSIYGVSQLHSIKPHNLPHTRTKTHPQENPNRQNIEADHDNRRCQSMLRWCQCPVRSGIGKSGPRVGPVSHQTNKYGTAKLESYAICCPPLIWKLALIF